MRIENQYPTTVSEKEAPWFQITQAESENIDAFAESNFKLAVLSHLKYRLEEQEKQKDAEVLMKHIEDGLTIASQSGYTENSHISRFILVILGNLALTQQHADMVRKSKKSCCSS